MLRSDCASTQSDQQFCGSLLCSIIPIIAKPKVSSLSLVSVTEQAGLSLTWSHATENRFSRDEALLVLMRAITLSMQLCCGRGHYQISPTVTRRCCNCWTHEHRLHYLFHMITYAETDHFNKFIVKSKCYALS